MKTFFDDVGEFHRKFNLPVTQEDRACVMPTQQILDYRYKFLKEELQEYYEAVLNNNLPEALDALVDLAWVAMGTAHFFGAPFNDAWREVVRANMSKVLKREDDGEHKRGMVETIRKPLGWKAPDIRYVIDWHNYKVRNEA